MASDVETTKPSLPHPTAHLPPRGAGHGRATWPKTAPCIGVLLAVVALLVASPWVTAAPADGEPDDPWAADGRAPHRSAHYMLLSNSPETVRRPGVLFDYVLEPGIRYRLFFHHLNGTGDAAELAITLGDPLGEGADETAGAEPSARARRALVGLAGIAVSPQPFTSGWLAARAYATEPVQNLEAPWQPGSADTVWRTFLAHGHVATGYVFVESDVPAALQVRLGDSDNRLPPDGIHQRGAVANPQLERDIFFSLAERTMDVPFGVSGAFRDVERGEGLRGDWGIEYRFNLTVHNPFDVPMPFHILFIPRGGDGRLLALLDGEPAATDRTFSGHYFLVRRWVIHPGRTRTFSLWTMPISAMGYPAVLRLSTHVDAGWPRHPTSP